MSIYDTLGSEKELILSQLSIASHIEYEEKHLQFAQIVAERCQYQSAQELVDVQLVSTLAEVFEHLSHIEVSFRHDLAEDEVWNVVVHVFRPVQ